MTGQELTPNHKGQCWITTERGSEGAIVDAAAGRLCRDRVIPAMKARADRRHICESSGRCGSRRVERPIDSAHPWAAC